MQQSELEVAYIPEEQQGLIARIATCTGLDAALHCPNNSRRLLRPHRRFGYTHEWFERNMQWVSERLPRSAVMRDELRTCRSAEVAKVDGGNVFISQVRRGGTVNAETWEAVVQSCAKYSPEEREREYRSRVMSRAFSDVDGFLFADRYSQDRWIAVPSLTGDEYRLADQGYLATNFGLPSSMFSRYFPDARQKAERRYLRRAELAHEFVKKTLELYDIVRKG